MNNSYRDDFYRYYVSTHTAARKGALTSRELLVREKIYDQRFGPHIPKDKSVRIADCGCGNGSIVWWLNKKGYPAAEGVDVSAEQIEEGKALGIKNLFCGDLLAFLGDRSECYDILILRNVIEHFDKNEILQLLSMCYKSLKANGKIILQTPNAESPFFGRIRYGDFTHEIAFTNSSMCQLLLVAGFKQPKCLPCRPVITGLKPALRAMMWRLIECMYGIILFSETGTTTPVMTLDLIGIGKKT